MTVPVSWLFSTDLVFKMSNMKQEISKSWDGKDDTFLEIDIAPATLQNEQQFTATVN